MIMIPTENYNMTLQANLRYPMSTDQPGCHMINNTLWITHAIPLFKIIPLINPSPNFIAIFLIPPYKANFESFHPPLN